MKKYTQYRLEPDTGYLIVVEGIDGSGKTTLAKLLSTKLNLIGYDVIYVRNPGSTKLSEKIRNIVLHNENLTNDEQALLFTTAMSNTLREIVVPAIIKKKIVIMDRYYHSLYVYQNFYKDIKRELLFNALYKSLINICKQDYFILAKAKPEICKSRIDERNEKDVFDSKNINYFKEISEVYYSDSIMMKKLNQFLTEDKKIIINTENQIHDSISEIFKFLKKS